MRMFSQFLRISQTKRASWYILPFRLNSYRSAIPSPAKRKNIIIWYYNIFVELFCASCLPPSLPPPFTAMRGAIRPGCASVSSKTREREREEGESPNKLSLSLALSLLVSESKASARGLCMWPHQRVVAMANGLRLSISSRALA